MSLYFLELFVLILLKIKSGNSIYMRCIAKLNQDLYTAQWVFWGSKSCCKLSTRGTRALTVTWVPVWWTKYKIIRVHEWTLKRFHVFISFFEIQQQNKCLGLYSILTPTSTRVPAVGIIKFDWRRQIYGLSKYAII